MIDLLKSIIDLPISMKGDSKRTSGNSLGMHYMSAHHIVVQHKLNKHCVQSLVMLTKRCAQCSNKFMLHDYMVC